MTQKPIKQNNMKTAIEWLVEQIKSDQNQKALSASEWLQVFEQAKQMENKQMISFNKWMRENDTAENAEQYANYSDKDMLIEFKIKHQIN